MMPAPFVGRDRELAELRRRLDPGAGGDFVLLVAEAGMGKSQLVNAVTTDAVGVVRVPAPPAQQFPLWRTWNLDLDRCGAAVGTSSDGTSLPEERADALVARWETIAVPRRPTLVVEDAHWADEETLRLLERLVRSGVPRSLRLLVTTRPQGGSAQRLLAAAGANGGVVLELAPWDEPESLRFASELLGAPELDPALVQQVREAEGWPLLIDELVSAWRRGSHGRSGFKRLGSLVAERLAALSDSERLVVTRAALLGSDPDTELLVSSFAGIAEVGQALRSAVAAGLMSMSEDDGSVRFRHDLVRDAVLSDVLDIDRRDHALRLLEVLAEPSSWSWRWRQVAALATLLGRLDLAVAACLDGASALLSFGSPLQAAALADHAASLAHGPAKVRALAVSVRAHALAGDVGAALAAGDRFDAAQAIDPNPDLVTGVLQARARALGLNGRWSEALQLLDDDEASSVRCLALLETGDLEGARTVAVTVLDTVEDPAARCEAMEVAGRVARGTDLDAAERWFARAVAQAESAQLPLWRARALHELATISQVRRLEVEPLYEAREAALSSGAAGLLTSIDFHIAAVHGVRFEPEPALEAGRRLLTDARSLGLRPSEAWAWILIAQAHAVAGERLRAEQALNESLALAGEDEELRAMTSGIAALAALVDDDLVAAQPLWFEAVQGLRRTPAVSPLPPWYLWPLLATVADLEGDGGARARAEVTGSGLVHFTGLAGLCRLADAVALGRSGDRLEAAEHWKQGLTLLGEVPAFVGWLHMARVMAAPAADADGWGDPAAWIVEAETWFAERGLLRLVARCRRIGRDLGVPTRRRGRGLAEVPAHLVLLGVTSREMDVLLLVAEGLTNAQVAQRLVVSPGTVKGYVERLLAKTGAANRTGLAAYLVER